MVPKRLQDSSEGPTSVKELFLFSFFFFLERKNVGHGRAFHLLHSSINLYSSSNSFVSVEIFIQDQI